jgi:hypothetical protein
VPRIWLDSLRAGIREALRLRIDIAECETGLYDDAAGQAYFSCCAKPDQVTLAVKSEGQYPRKVCRHQIFFVKSRLLGQYQLPCDTKS